jgi:transposase InsO family protein
METFTYVESYYNRAPGRPALGYQSTEDFEQAYYHRTETRENFGYKPG